MGGTPACGGWGVGPGRAFRIPYAAEARHPLAAYKSLTGAVTFPGRGLGQGDTGQAYSDIRYCHLQYADSMLQAG